MDSPQYPQYPPPSSVSETCPEGHPESRPEGRPDGHPNGRLEGCHDSRPESGPEGRPEGPLEIRPEGRPDSRPEGRLESRPENWSENRPGSRPEGWPEGRSGIRPEGWSGSRPEGRPEVRSGARPGSRPGVRHDGRTESRPEIRPDGRPGVHPGGRSGGRPEARSEGRPQGLPRESKLKMYMGEPESAMDPTSFMYYPPPSGTSEGQGLPAESKLKMYMGDVEPATDPTPFIYYTPPPTSSASEGQGLPPESMLVKYYSQGEPTMDPTPYVHYPQPSGVSEGHGVQLESLLTTYYGEGEAAVDPNPYMQYRPPSSVYEGQSLPPESKLKMYMDHSTQPASASGSQDQTLSHAMGNLSLESQQSMNPALINEFIPMSYYQPIMMPHEIQDQPPSATMAMPPEIDTPTTQVRQENVGGTTYFYSKACDPNAPGLTLVASAGSDVSVASTIAPGGTTTYSTPYVSPYASPYTPHMFAAPPPNMNNANMKPAGSWPVPMVAAGYGPAAAGYGSATANYGPTAGGYMPAAATYGPAAARYGHPPAGYRPMPLGYGAAAPTYGPPAAAYAPAAAAAPFPCQYPQQRSTVPGVVSPPAQPQYPPAPPDFSPAFSHDSNNDSVPDFTGSLAASFYNPETIRKEIYHRNEDVFLQGDPNDLAELPDNVEMYTNLVPLEDVDQQLLASSYRAVHRETGQLFALRRLHGCTAGPTKRLENWKAVDNSNVVKLHDYMSTLAFGDRSVVLVYSYHQGCETLKNKFLSGGAPNTAAEVNALMDPFSSDPNAPRPYTHQKNAMLRAVACGVLLPEAVLWSLVVQLSAGLRALHNAGLACRCLDSSKVVMCGPRARIAWPGVADAVPGNAVDLLQAQQDDLVALGRLALALACRTVHCDNIAASVDLVARTYSSDFKNVIMYLLSGPSRKSLTDLMPMIGARYYTQVDALQRRADVFEDLLAVEIDNSRILRILIKLGVINERPELNMDASWCETGDRYLLKLFRDKLFHGVTEDGLPWIDLVHLTATLNNLDGGSDDKVELISRDEQSVLVVSYAELKKGLDTAFNEVIGVSLRP